MSPVERWTLVQPAASPGAPDLALLARRPTLPPGVTPDIIIGHGRITGPAALTLAEDIFPGARRVHVVHMAPDEIEWLKVGRRGDAGERAETLTTIELELGRTAYLLLAVGPRLHDRYLNEMSAFGSPSPVRIDPGFDVADSTARRPPPGAPLRILLLARAEAGDASIKGLDLAARAVGLAVHRRLRGMSEIELVVRGAPPGRSESLWRKLRALAGQPSLSIVVRPFTARQDRLVADLRRASLAIMTSRKEGFGLVGVDAIVAGTPVLVSASSGLGILLQEALRPDESAHFIVPMSGDDDEDAERWSRAIEGALRDREASFGRANELRRLMSERNSWSVSIACLALALERDGATREVD